MDLYIVIFIEICHEIADPMWLYVFGRGVAWWQNANGTLLSYIMGAQLATSTKGQLISECLFDVFNFPKTNETFDKFLPYNLKSGQIIRQRHTLATLIQIMYKLYWILWFVDLTTFYILGEIFVKFFVGFLENLRLSKRHSEINWPLHVKYYGDMRWSHGPGICVKYCLSFPHQRKLRQTIEI